jgi:hypothetical protein
MTAQQVKLPFFKTGKFSHTEPKYGLMCSGLLAVQGSISLRRSNPFNPIYFVLISKLVKLFHIGLEFGILHARAENFQTTPPGL